MHDRVIGWAAEVFAERVLRPFVRASVRVLHEELTEVTPPWLRKVIG